MLTLAEINGSKYVKVLSVSNNNSDVKIIDLGLRSRRLFAYEEMDTKELDKRYKKEPKISARSKDKAKKKYFHSINDLKTFDVIDAQDYKGDWYRGVILGSKIEKKYDYSIKVHFIEFGERWDEFYNEENLYKIAPAGTYAEEPHPKEYIFTAYHRLNQSFFEGIPLLVTLTSEMTWNEAYREIVTQATRYISTRSEYFRQRFGSRRRARTKSVDLTDNIEDVIAEPPFKISFLESTGTKCFFCSLEAKGYSSREKEKKFKLLSCKGCSMRRDEEKIKWLLS